MQRRCPLDYILTFDLPCPSAGYFLWLMILAVVVVTVVLVGLACFAQKKLQMLRWVSLDGKWMATAPWMHFSLLSHWAGLCVFFLPGGASSLMFHSPNLHRWENLLKLPLCFTARCKLHSWHQLFLFLFFQIEDVEEVEPYASYVQRVNSIYNWAAALVTVTRTYMLIGLFEKPKAVKLRGGEIVEEWDDFWSRGKPLGSVLEKNKKHLIDGTGDFQRAIHWCWCTVHAAHYSLCVGLREIINDYKCNYWIGKSAICR